MRLAMVSALGAALWSGLAASAFAMPIQIDINKGLPDAISFRTDSSDLTVTPYPDPDPTLSSSFVSASTVIFGPDPEPPSDPSAPPPPAGNYTYYQEYDLTFSTNFLISDPLKFSAAGPQITFDSFTYKIAAYEVTSDGNILGPYMDTYNSSISAFSVSVVSAVPLPAAAPMFGAALLALGTAGYGRRRKIKAPA